MKYCRELMRIFNIDAVVFGPPDMMTVYTVYKSVWGINSKYEHCKASCRIVRQLAFFYGRKGTEAPDRSAGTGLWYNNR